MTKEEIQTMANKIGEVAPKLAAQFIADPDNFDYSQLEHYTKFTDKYKNVSDFVGDKAGIKANIWQQLEGKFPTEARFLSLQQEYPWLNKEDLQEWFDKSNAYKAEYEAEREAEAARKRREQEVAGTYVDINDPADTTGRNWGFLRNILASDYEKQRYIDAPQEAIFGKDAPGFVGSSTGAKADLATGIAGGVADAMPFVKFAPIGPAIRTSRDIAHKVTDSPYQKEWSEVGVDAVKDLGFNLGAAFLANAKRGQRIASLATDPKVGEALALADETKNIEKGLDKLSNVLYSGSEFAKDDAQLYKTVMTMPESELKTKLIPLVEAFGTQRPIVRSDIQTVANKYSGMIEPTRTRFNKAAEVKGRPDLVVDPDPGAYKKMTLSYTPFSELNPLHKLEYGFNRLAQTVNTGGLGQAAFQSINTARGRGNQPNIVETALRQKEKEDTIDRMISSYSLLWNTKNPPPEAKDSPLIKAAWEKWKAGK